MAKLILKHWSSSPSLLLLLQKSNTAKNLDVSIKTNGPKVPSSSAKGKLKSLRNCFFSRMILATNHFAQNCSNELYIKCSSKCTGPNLINKYYLNTIMLHGSKVLLLVNRSYVKGHIQSECFISA